MRDVLVFSCELLFTILVSAWIVRRDVKRLAPELLSRAWPEPSLWAAVVCFSPICVFIHFARTRRSLFGLALGVAWLVVAVLAVNAASWLVDAGFRRFG